MKYAIDKTDRLSLTIYTDDGGVASIYHNGDIFITEYYQSRMSEISEEQWSVINEGKIYYMPWPNKLEIDGEMIEDSLRWLASSHINFYEVELEGFTINKPNAPKSFINLKKS